ncbi:MAG TPA: SMC family ATPase, partial [Firmicutes bacterium]|nr:SMC family ATPase [Bacillota bacterium]
MEPVKLTLRNFLSYRDETVDLEPVQCAALVGENGAGKSSLLDAITWCLYGQGTKGGIRELDNYVTRGETECRVELNFRLAGQTYRVIRVRSIKGKSALEFYVENGADWRPLSGKTIGETQEAIDSVLRMDYRSLTASALTLQGEADALTADMTDAERKEVLGRILGLDLWDQMQERVREKGRQLKAELAAVEQTRQRLLSATAEKPSLEARRAQAMADLEAKAAEIDRVAAEVSDLEARIRQKPTLEQTLAEVTRAVQRCDETIRQAAGEITRAEQQIAEAEQVIKRNEGLLARRTEIEAAVEMEAEIARDVTGMDQAAQEYIRLDQAATALERQAGEWERRTEAEAARLEAQIQAATRQAS